MELLRKEEEPQLLLWLVVAWQQDGGRRPVSFGDDPQLSIRGVWSIVAGEDTQTSPRRLNH